MGGEEDYNGLYYPDYIGMIISHHKDVSNQPATTETPRSESVSKGGQAGRT